MYSACRLCVVMPGCVSCIYFKLLCCPFICLFIFFSLYLSFAKGSSSTIASNPADIPQALWTRGRRLNRSEDLIDGQPVFYSLPPVIRQRPRKHSVSEQRTTPSVDSQIGIPITAIEIDLPIVQTNQDSMATPTGVEEMMRQMQETMRAMQ